MSAQTKPKSASGKVFNDARPSRKGFKKSPGRKHHRTPDLNPVQKVLMGKGMLVTTERLPGDPWVGMSAPAKPPYNTAQVRENRRLYPHLFEQPKRVSA
jgi:hypothetical protein